MPGGITKTGAAGVEWHTPVDLVRDLQAAVGGFDLDPASGCEPDPIADHVYTIEDDGLAQSWFGKVFVNPPYGRAENPAWSAKIAAEGRNPDVSLLVAIVPANVDTGWWHDHIATADKICLCNGRIKFGGAASSGTFPSAIAIWGDSIPPGLLEVLETRGVFYETRVILPRTGFGVGDRLSLRLSTDGVDSVADVEVLAGEATAQSVEVAAVVRRDDGEDTWVALSAPTHDLSDIRCQIARPDGEWRHAHLSRLSPRSTGGRPSVGYVC